jgi:RNA polymerase sigma-70 factor (ECF subfamily)
METEAEILDALRSPDHRERSRGEFEIFRQYQPQIRALLTRALGAGADLDDAVQESFIDIFRGLPRFEGRSGLGTWIFRIALRRGWKCAARRETRRQREIGGEALVEHATGTSGDDLQTREMAQRLEAALAELSFEHRSIIALSGLEGLCPNEVAATLGIPVGTVHSRLSRSKEKLKELLSEDGVRDQIIRTTFPPTFLV